MSNNTDLIKRIYEAFNSRDYPGVLEFLDANILWIVADHSPLSDRNPYRGLDAVRDGVFARIAAAFERFTVRADEFLDAGNKIVVLGYYDGLLKGKEPSFQTQVAHIWSIENGKVVKLQQYTDTYQLAQSVRPPK